MSTEGPTTADQDPFAIRFSSRIVEVAKELSALTLDRLVERFGEPPLGAKDYLESFAVYVPFDSPEHAARSRLLEGSIAGSDTYAFARVDAFTDAQGHMREPLFPGRCVDMILRYGHARDAKPPIDEAYRLYALEKNRPMLASRQALTRLYEIPAADKPFSEFSAASVEAIDFLQNGAKARDIYYPSSDELQLITNGLASVRTDTKTRELLTIAADACKEDGLESESQWLVRCIQQLKGRNWFEK